MTVRANLGKNAGTRRLFKRQPDDALLDQGCVDRLLYVTQIAEHC
ncbi:MAG: hypothetical protein ACLQNV_15400 [Steroidobacteraceae bacterium]